MSTLKLAKNPETVKERKDKLKARRTVLLDERIALKDVYKGKGMQVHKIELELATIALHEKK